MRYFGISFSCIIFDSSFDVLFSLYKNVIIALLFFW
nr:MAG TPA: hypothetical protein [Bacteriophage sp.]DAJ45748.1 MAG TPA: hypothetical protein [Caudoviricetes sp.]DAK61736.1 MAG TPA: hypothetical protein [Bacteriophage sp.]DAR53515.1 MAG TPA: hypothetical protein [Caudoviricetes sp.]DAW89603.1 MAG TPA: hypothetical protein [Bacteriophage sp.]